MMAAPTSEKTMGSYIVMARFLPDTDMQEVRFL